MLSLSSCCPLSYLFVVICSMRSSLTSMDRVGLVLLTSISSIRMMIALACLTASAAKQMIINVRERGVQLVVQGQRKSF